MIPTRKLLRYRQRLLVLFHPHEWTNPEFINTLDKLIAEIWQDGFDAPNPDDLKRTKK